MPRITAMEGADRGARRVTVYVEDAAVVEAHPRAVARLGLRVGQDVEPQSLAGELQREEEAAARDAALSLLGYRARTAREVTQQLQRRGYDAAVAEEVVARLQRAGLVDDRSFAEAWVAQRGAGRRSIGRGRLAAELLRRGVERETVSASVEQLDAQREREAAMSLARERASRMGGGDPLRERQRLLGMLRRRGYDWELCLAAVNAAMGEEGE